METVTLAAIFLSVSQTLALPPGLLSALCHVESNHRSHIVHVNDGVGTSVGLCQLKLSSARQMGFGGTEQDLIGNVQINAYYAAAYLRHQLDRYDQDVVSAISAYNAGHKSVHNLHYVRKVLNAWAEHR